MPPETPTCSDCDHAFELHDAADLIVCSAHLEYRPIDHPAGCPHYAPRKSLTESSVTEIWREPR